MNLVSVVIPTYNRADLVIEAMSSVRDQTYRPIECIVVDDGSTDDTPEVVADWKKKHEADRFTVRMLRQENRGAPAARNRGMEAASGEFLLFLDSDDRLVANAVDLLRRTLSEGGHDVAYGDIRLMEGPGQTRRREQRPSSSSHVVNMLNNAPQTSSALLKRDTVASVRWREDLPRAQEFAFFLDLALQGARFTYVSTDVLEKDQRSERRGISNRQMQITPRRSPVFLPVGRSVFGNSALLRTERMTGGSYTIRICCPEEGPLAWRARFVGRPIWAGFYTVSGSTGVRMSSSRRFFPPGGAHGFTRCWGNDSGRQRRGQLDSP